MKATTSIRRRSSPSTCDTGERRWHYQFTPHDVHDWDSTQVPVLGDLTIDGQPRKVVMFANRNGFFYTIDRVTGKVIVAKPFVETTWAKEIDSNGRPVLLPGHLPDEDGTKTCPDLGGGTNFMSPSFDPTTRLFFVTARETCADLFRLRPEASSRAINIPAAGRSGRAIRRISGRFAPSTRSPPRSNGNSATPRRPRPE